MAKLKETQFDLIKRYVSHPSGMGYVADFSNQTFSTWFRDTWNVDIDDPKDTRFVGKLWIEVAQAFKDL